jgi:predicted nucleic acid-binding Zn ribbon protein
LSTWNIEARLKMKLQRPRSLAELLQSGDIGRLTRQAEERRVLLEQIRESLSAEEGEHLVGAGYDDEGTLIVTMDSAAWAARVRYRARDLTTARLRVKVVPR